MDKGTHMLAYNLYSCLTYTIIDCYPDPSNRGRLSVENCETQENQSMLPFVFKKKKKEKPVVERTHKIPVSQSVFHHKCVEAIRTWL